MSNPVAHHIFFREIIEPTWAEYDGPADVVKTLDYDNYDENMQATTQWLYKKLCGLDVKTRPSTSHSGEEPTESAVISAKDMSLLIDCIQALWKNSNQNESHPQSKYLRHGRGLKFGQWKIENSVAQCWGRRKAIPFLSSWNC